jgi:peptide/nickel transport system permease protein
VSTVLQGQRDSEDAVRLQRRARRLAHAPRRSLRIGLGMLALLILASAIGPLFVPGPDKQDLFHTLAAPSGAHLFGTDNLGRDVLSRTLAATWIDLGIGLGTTYVSVTIGVLLGTTAGYLGGWAERIIMRLSDVVIAFPFIVLVIAIVTIVGPGVKGVLIGLVVGGWAFYARFSRAEMLSLREKPFIEAARTLGYSNRRVILRHALPNLIRPSIVYSFSDIVLNILVVASLSYLGLGVQPPTPEWGAIISSGRDYLLTAWWITTLPGLVLVLVGVAFSFIGDGLADRLRVGREIAR